MADKITKYGPGNGLAYGEIAPMFIDVNNWKRGAFQYDMPLCMDDLRKLNILSIVK